LMYVCTADKPEYTNLEKNYCISPE